KPATMDEVVIFYAGEGQGEFGFRKDITGFRFRQQGDGLAFPCRPGDRSLDLLLAIIADKELPIGGNHVAALRLWNRCLEALPLVGEHLRHPELIVPLKLGARERIDATHDKLADPVRVGLGIGQRQGRTPGAAEYQPFLEATHFAQPLNIGNQMPGRICLQRGIGERAAAATLVEKDQVVALWIEQAPVLWRNAATRPAVQEDSRLAATGADTLPIYGMPVANIEHASLERIDLGI